MKLIVPKYFHDFECIANECTDSCCIGWEIGVDPDTEERYRALSGEMGDRIRENLTDGEHVCIRLSGERCPFLDSDGLCDIIKTLGEGYLTEICTEHPRYYLTLGETVFGGLGASCEEAARLILTHGDRGYAESDAPGFEYEECDDEAYSATYRAYISAIEAAHSSDDLYTAAVEIARITEDLDREINGDFSEKISHAPHPNTENRENILNIYHGLEYMRARLLPLIARATEAESLGESEYGSRILTYFLDRYYMTIACDGDAMGCLGFILLSSFVLSRITRECDIASAVDLFKEYSKEIEYSEENVEKIKNMTRLGIFDTILPFFTLKASKTR